MEHQRPDDAEEEAEQGESDDPPDKGREAEPEHSPIGVQGRREHPVRSGPSKARGTTWGLVGYLGLATLLSPSPVPSIHFCLFIGGKG